jgi:hypothetical protein
MLVEEEVVVAISNASLLSALNNAKRVTEVVVVEVAKASFFKTSLLFVVAVVFDVAFFKASSLSLPPFAARAPEQRRRQLGRLADDNIFLSRTARADFFCNEHLLLKKESLERKDLFTICTTSREHAHTHTHAHARARANKNVRAHSLPSDRCTRLVYRRICEDETTRSFALLVVNVLLLSLLRDVVVARKGVVLKTETK